MKNEEKQLFKQLCSFRSEQLDEELFWGICFLTECRGLRMEF